MHILEHKDFIIANKPNGIPTHSPDHGKFGFIEYLSEKLKCKLYVCHRLDKETSGAIVFAKSKEAATKITSEFTKQKVEKKYIFITDRFPKVKDQITVKSEISKKKNSFISIKNQTPNSKTDFIKLSSSKRYSIWQAIPKTGKPHQIRLHAESIGLNILGDNDHNGSKFSRLMLHAKEISFNLNNEKIRYKSTLPSLFNSEGLIDNKSLRTYFNAINKREIIYDLDSPINNTYRIIHNEAKNFRCDKLGEILWFYWYNEELPNNNEAKEIKTICAKTNISKFKVQLMKNRGATPKDLESLSNIIGSSWIATENNVKYVLKKEQGYSPGLFLDQRNNRNWLMNNSKNKQVLNLFCYTAGFSVCAALGGAKEVVSVDTSKATLSWAKENFTANNLDETEYEFYANDTREFIKGALKRNRKFDIIICDPPSFARNKQGVFKINKDFQNLISSLYKILKTNGRILFSSNYEKWSKEDFINKVDSLNLPKFSIQRCPLPDLDYEMPNEDTLMKAFFICKG